MHLTHNRFPGKASNGELVRAPLGLVAGVLLLDGDQELRRADADVAVLGDERVDVGDDRRVGRVPAAEHVLEQIAREPRLPSVNELQVAAQRLERRRRQRQHVGGYGERQRHLPAWYNLHTKVQRGRRNSGCDGQEVQERCIDAGDFHVLRGLHNQRLDRRCDVQQGHYAAGCELRTNVQLWLLKSNATPIR